MLPPQGLLGYSKVPLSIRPFWDGPVEKKMLSDRCLNITVRDMRRIVSRSGVGVSFPREILASDDSGELSQHVGISARLCSDIVIFHYSGNFTPALVQLSEFLPDVLGLLTPVRFSPIFCRGIRGKSGYRWRQKSVAVFPFFNVLGTEDFMWLFCQREAHFCCG
jgi:hypothetical protein